jgi:Iron-containing redox enzyme
MELLDSRAVAESLACYVRDRLAESDFFSDLSGGEVPPGHLREVFGQYYLWRSRFRGWLDACAAKIAPFGDGRNGPRVPGELIDCLAQEARGNQHGQALSLLAALGVDDPAGIAALPVTDAYADSFLCCYLRPDRSGEEALAALAGRELAVPGRNEIIVSALPRHYGVTAGLGFFRSYTGLDPEHFRTLWETFTRDRKADSRQLIEAARLEIWEHITFWDDVYSTVLATDHSPAVDQVMAENK